MHFFSQHYKTGETVHFYCLRCPVCGPLLRQPEQANTRHYGESVWPPTGFLQVAVSDKGDHMCSPGILAKHGLLASGKNWDAGTCRGDMPKEQVVKAKASGVQSLMTARDLNTERNWLSCVFLPSVLSPCSSQELLWLFMWVLNVCFHLATDKPWALAALPSVWRARRAWSWNI